MVIWCRSDIGWIVWLGMNLLSGQGQCADGGLELIRLDQSHDTIGCAVITGVWSGVGISFWQGQGADGGLELVWPVVILDVGGCASRRVSVQA